MTEKQYGWATGRGTDKIAKAHSTINAHSSKHKEILANSKPKAESDNSSSEKDNYVKAGKIASEVVKYAKSLIKKEMPLLEIADKIEGKIIELKAKPAFPVNISANEITAHDTPAFNDTRIARGLLKIDIGVHLDGIIADTAFSLDLENSEENKKLIEAAESALQKAIEAMKIGAKLREVGASIEKEIKSRGFTPITNLSGHSIEPWTLHSGVTIPNHDNSKETLIEEGIYAIEPFATIGFGSVKEGKPSGIYKIEKEGPVRDSFAREVLAFISEEYKTLPFCARWIQKKFGTRGLLALKRIEDAGLLRHYPQLIETGAGKVSQAEHTLILEKDKKIITTL